VISVCLPATLPGSQEANGLDVVPVNAVTEEPSKSVKSGQAGDILNMPVANIAVISSNLRLIYACFFV
jgi:hypothetical protein